MAMAMMVGKEAKIYLEDVNGNLVDITADSVCLSIYSQLPELGGIGRGFLRQTSAEITVNFTGHYDLYDQLEWHEHVNQLRSEHEWMCDYCKSPNPRKNTHCSQCGAVRSFLYE